jgi:prepilin-type N-terminal cleavage/methylation domain-containing protein
MVFYIKYPSFRGFTLVELMISVAIVAIIASSGVVLFSSAQKNARITKRAQDLKAMQEALELYKQGTGAYPVQANWVCISSLSVLVPKYIGSLPSDPLDNGNPAGPNCYQYKSGPIVILNREYKVRTNPRVYTSGEMNSEAFSQQKELIDTAKDSIQNCSVDDGPYTGWSVYNGGEICGDPAEAVYTPPVIRE